MSNTRNLSDLARDTNLKEFGETFTLPTTDGSSGQVLSTNGSGGLSFATPPAGYANSDVDSHLNTGTATTDQILSWTGSDYDWIDSGGGGLFTEASSGVWETPVITSAEIDGDLIVTGDATSLSDERFKENITPVTDALDIVDSINGVYYNLKKSPDKRNVGVIAQNVEQVLPEVVHETDGYKSVAYGNIVGVLVEAIKELRKEIEELKDGLQ